MKGAALLWHQYRYDQKQFWREPASVFFAVVLPLIFLFIFVSIFGNQTNEVDGHLVKGSTYYVPGILALAIVSATIVNLAISFTILRQKGLLKRVRSTPLPPWIFLAGRILTAIVVTVLLVVAVTFLGRLVYGVTLPSRTLPGLALTVLVGTAACCTLGFALTAAIPSEAAAPAITNAIILPLYFFSGIFIPIDQIPRAMRFVADLFPVKPLFESVFAAFDPLTTGAGVRAGDLAVLLGWGVAGLVIATRTFRWVPRGG